MSLKYEVCFLRPGAHNRDGHPTLAQRCPTHCAHVSGWCWRWLFGNNIPISPAGAHNRDGHPTNTYFYIYIYIFFYYIYIYIYIYVCVYGYTVPCPACAHNRDGHPTLAQQHPHRNIRWVHIIRWVTQHWFVIYGGLYCAVSCRCTQAGWTSSTRSTPPPYVPMALPTVGPMDHPLLGGSKHSFVVKNFDRLAGAHNRNGHPTLAQRQGGPHPRQGHDLPRLRSGFEPLPRSPSERRENHLNDFKNFYEKVKARIK